MNYGWSGVLVEPNPDLIAELLKKNRKAYIFPHCLSTSTKVETLKFEVLQFSSGLFMNSNKKPSVYDKNPRNDKFKREIQVRL